MKIFITGNAGFIGYHLTLKCLSKGYEVIGLDNINDYYDVQLKISRLRNLGIETYPENLKVKSSLFPSFEFIKGNLEDTSVLDYIFTSFKPDLVIHLAAQAGVRYSITNPEKYIQSNIIGFFNIINACKKFQVNKFIYASSSSVYGDHQIVPFDEKMNVDKPISFYAATKKSNELIAHCYSHLFNIQTIGLRFFTVYGPFGRPDMAYFSFTKSIIENKRIDVYNNGNLSRDFTYIDDIVNGIDLILTGLVSKESKLDQYEVFNIGNSNPEKLITFINVLEKIIEKPANINFLPMQDGDVHDTYADVGKLKEKVDYLPKTKLNEGLFSFVKWYKEYYNVK